MRGGLSLPPPPVREQPAPWSRWTVSPRATHRDQGTELAAGLRVAPSAEGPRPDPDLCWTWTGRVLKKKLRSDKTGGINNSSVVERGNHAR